jgi:predicted  nucleic acid-binding Zn-ribbon protein
MAQDASLAGAPDVLHTMMDLSQATKSLQKATLEWKNVKERADKINKEALELQELVEKAQEEVQRLKAQLQPKRERIEAQEEEEDDIENVNDWTLTKHRSEATRVQSRRNTTMGSHMHTHTYTL